MLPGLQWTAWCRALYFTGNARVNATQLADRFIFSSSCSPGRNPQSRPDSMRSRFSTVIARLRSSALAGLSFGKNDSTGWSRRRILLATATPVSVEVRVFVTEATSCGTFDRYG